MPVPAAKQLRQAPPIFTSAGCLARKDQQPRKRGLSLPDERRGTVVITPEGAARRPTLPGWKFRMTGCVLGLKRVAKQGEWCGAAVVCRYMRWQCQPGTWDGAPGRIRTSDLRGRNPLLCPLSYGRVLPTG